MGVGGAGVRVEGAPPNGGGGPRGAEGSPAAPRVDRETPLLLVKVGRYPLHHGGVGAIRSLGRLGVPVHAIVESRATPAAVSRYLRRRHVWPTTGGEPEDELLAGLREVGRRLLAETGRPAVALATDDEAAVLLAERAEELAPYLTGPDVPARLPRLLAGKQSLHELCRRHGIPTPRSLLPASHGELLAVASDLVFPLVVKNADPYHRLHSPGVRATTLVPGPAALRALADPWREAMPRVLLQEYLPREHAEDWIVHLYRGTEEGADVVFTGVKVRSWPPRGGVTAHAYAAPNPDVAELSLRLCRAVGFRGIGDLDWRYDRRDGRYKLLDFNPRLGAQFRLFETDRGIDVVRALHLDLTGRAVPVGRQRDGRRFTVEFFDAPARVAARRDGGAAQLPAAMPPARGGAAHELAWAAPDDPLPAAVAALHAIGPAVHRLRARLTRR